MLSYFSLFRDEHYARSGCIATEEFALEKGPLPIDIAPHPLEPTLRKLGLPTRLNASIVELLADTVVCKAGDVLTPEQCRLLQLFDVKQAAFRIHIIAALTSSADDGSATLEVIREAATSSAAQLDQTTAALSRQRRHKGGVAAAEEEEEASMAAGEGNEEDEDEDEEFVPSPLEGWGEVTVPSY